MLNDNKILVVDDQPGIRLLLKDTLSLAGHNVTTASNGKEALEAVKKSNFNLILLDYQIPILNGGKFIKELERNNLKIPVIIMSGLVENIDDETKNNSLVVDIIMKPFDITHIQQFIETALVT